MSNSTSMSKVDYTFDHLDLLVKAVTRDILIAEGPKLPLGAELNREAVEERVSKQLKLGLQWIAERSPRVNVPSGISSVVWKWIRDLAPVEVKGNASTVRLVLNTTEESRKSIESSDGLVYSVRSVREENFLDPAVMAAGIAINSNVSNDLYFGSRAIMTATADWQKGHCVVRSAHALTGDQAILAAALSLESPVTPQKGHPDCFEQTVLE